MSETPWQTIGPDWLQWLADFASAAERFTAEEPVPVSTDEEHELVAVKMALYARALTLFDGAKLLIENDRQLDFRIHARGIIEATMYLIALDGDPTFISKMKDDDYKSRQKRAALHLNANTFKGTAEVKQMLADFVALGLQGAKGLPVESLVDGSDFERLYRTFRDISGDAAHVSMTSLNRHYTENPANKLALLQLHPALDDFEIFDTISEMSISMTIATLMLMKVKQKTELWDEFMALNRRYRELTKLSQAQLDPNQSPSSTGAMP